VFIAISIAAAICLSCIISFSEKYWPLSIVGRNILFDISAN